MVSATPLALGNRFFQLAVAATLLIAVAWFLIPQSLEIAPHVPIPAFLQGEEKQQSAIEETSELEVSRPYDSIDEPVKIDLSRPHHPIDDLIQQANEDFVNLLRKEAGSLEDAAEAYRARRGRQPPPGFDAWYEYATSQSVLVIEEFFDRIYDDLNPFWGIPAKQIREQANGFLYRVSVRNGQVEKRSDEEDRPWMDLWMDMVGSVAEYLPDVDLPINIMDESRIIVPWEEINDYMAKERETRKMVPAAELKMEYQNLLDLDRDPPEPFAPEFDRDYPYWPKAVIGCPPDSPARNAQVETDYTAPPPLTGQYPERTYHGYVQNWTFATSPCDHPDLQGLHGTFVEPVSLSNTKQMFPMFGGSKLPMNNELLLPPAMYWTDNPFYSGGESHGAEWPEKVNTVMWRGAASGGRNTIKNWMRFQRHRFVSMINATSVKLAEAQPDIKPPNFVLPANDTYQLASREPGTQSTSLGDWVESWSDAAFVNLLCMPVDPENPRNCIYTDPYFGVEEMLPMKEQYSAKYLPDIDGNSFSGRYRGFLGSTSLPIKATIYKEWHDSRLVPWKHFVPMDNTFIDIYGIIEYFLGNREKDVSGHDDVAETIALDGKKWAEQVLRKEDMSVYVYRLLLEYARICDEDREVMGWADPDVP